VSEPQILCRKPVPLNLIAVNLAEDVRSHASGLLDTVRSHASGLLDTVRSHASGLLDTVRSHASGLLDTVRSHASGLLDSVRSHASGLLGTVRSHASGLLDTVDGLVLRTEQDTGGQQIVSSYFLLSSSRLGSWLGVTCQRAASLQVSVLCRRLSVCLSLSLSPTVAVDLWRSVTKQPDSALSISTGCRLDARKVRFRVPVGARIVSTSFSSALGPTQPRIHWAPGVLPAG
jgi:hypothetical protein